MHVDELFKRINEAVRDELKHINYVRDRFKVTGEFNVYSERWISQYFIRSLAAATGGGAVVLEVPFANAKSKRNDNHLDALIFNEDVAILAEFKTAWTPSHWQALALDSVRVRERFAPLIAERFRDTKKRDFYGFYGVDAWRERAAKAWVGGHLYQRWTLPEEFKRPSVQRGFEQVWVAQPEDAMKWKCDGYYLLYALERFTPDPAVVSPTQPAIDSQARLQPQFRVEPLNSDEQHTH